jgi:hypothetical protein
MTNFADLPKDELREIAAKGGHASHGGHKTHDESESSDVGYNSSITTLSCSPSIFLPKWEPGESSLLYTYYSTRRLNNPTLEHDSNES